MITLPQVIDSGALTVFEAQGEWFRLPTPSNSHLMVTSERHIREIADAPLQQLSLHAVAKEVIILKCLLRKSLTSADTSTQIYHVWFRVEGPKRHRRNWFCTSAEEPAHSTFTILTP